METVNVAGSTSTGTVIGGLNPSTMYSIQVAAVNWDGTGLYSNPRLALTLRKLFLAKPGGCKVSHKYVNKFRITCTCVIITHLCKY